MYQKYIDLYTLTIVNSFLWCNKHLKSAKMSQEEFLLKWNDHHNSFFSIMKELSESEVLTDVTLACGGEWEFTNSYSLKISILL